MEKICIGSFIATNPISLKDFKILNVLAKGLSGTVFLVEKIGGPDNGTLYAMKSVKKINCKTEIKRSILERKILATSEHPFVAKLFYSFQSERRLYYVMEYHQAGDFFVRTAATGPLREDQARFYLAEIILAIDHIHGMGYIYRDLKPENLLVDKDGHLVLTDFGLCGFNNKSKGQCGTLEFMAPEMFSGERQTKAADWWSLGVLMFTMLTGRPPFEGPDDKTIINSILNFEPRIPEDLSEDAISLIARLLTKNPKQRIGTGDVDDIMEHPYFLSIDWLAIMGKEINPPFVPTFADSLDLCSVESAFTTLDPKESQDGVPSEETPELFKDFEYVHPAVREDVCLRPKLHLISETTDLMKNLSDSAAVNSFEDKENEAPFCSDFGSILEPYPDQYSKKFRKNGLVLRNKKTGTTFKRFVVI